MNAERQPPWAQLRIVLLLIGILSLAIVGGGVWLGDALRLKACPLCIFQRVLFLALGALALVGALSPRASAVQRGFAVLVALTALGGMVTAGYQSWLQWVEMPSLECGFSDPNLIERFVDWLGTRWPRLFLATGFCSSKEWIFLRLSLANWAFLIFLGFAALALRAAAPLKRK